MEDNNENQILNGQLAIGEVKSEAISHKNNALKRLDVSINKHIELSEYKKSHILSYWFEDFSKYHDEERTFDTTSLKTFKRGDIIKVNLGFNVGNEIGGLHYCVVINKNDNPYSGTLNVIPLSSAKENKIYNKETCLDLGDELFNLLSVKLEKQRKLVNNKIIIFNKEKDNSEKTIDIRALVKNIDYLDKIKKEIDRMKHGSIAYIHQITTISKQRIFKTPILSKIKLSDKSLDLIDNKIIELFTK